MPAKSAIFNLSVITAGQITGRDPSCDFLRFFIYIFVCATLEPLLVVFVSGFVYKLAGIGLHFACLQKIEKFSCVFCLCCTIFAVLIFLLALSVSDSFML